MTTPGSDPMDAPPVPPTLPPAPPTLPASRPPASRALLLAAAAILLIAIVAVAFVIGVNRGKKSESRGSAATHSGSSASARVGNGFPATVGATIAATGTAASGIAVADARVVVVHYLDAVNAKDRAAAKNLICAQLADQWQATIDRPGGDFTVAVTKATFTGATSGSDGVHLAYSLDVRSLSTGESGTTAVTFTVVDDTAGLRICGEG